MLLERRIKLIWEDRAGFFVPSFEVIIQGTPAVSIKLTRVLFKKRKKEVYVLSVLAAGLVIPYPYSSV